MGTMKNKKNGFTLVEVIVSLILIGMFLGVFGPSISEIFKQTMNVSDNDQTFNLAYNRASAAANSQQDITIPENGTVTTFLGDNADVVLTVFDVADDGTETSVATYSPNKFVVYTSTYNGGRFGSTKQLCFNDYSVR